MNCEIQKEQYDRYRAALREEYPPNGNRKPTLGQSASLARLRTIYLSCISSEKPIQTAVSLAGRWDYGGKPGPVIEVNGNFLTVDMSAYGRQTADGIIVDQSTILVFFPDESYGADHVGKLVLPGQIVWDNNSEWTMAPY